MTQPMGSIPRRPKQDQLSKFEEGCISGVIALLTWPALAIINGAVFVKLWSWFVVPTFHVHHLALPAAIGLGYVVAFFARDDQIDVNDKRGAIEKALNSILTSLLRAALFFVFGAIVAAFM